MLYDASWLDFYLEGELMSVVYFMLLLFFLLPLSILITYQSFDTIRLEVYLCQLQVNLVNCTASHLFASVKILIRKRLWFQAITLMESRYNISKEKIYQYYNLIGFIYYNMCHYDLAQAYYLKALNIKKNYVPALQNLVKLYFKQGHYSLVLSNCKLILAYDENNKVAQRYLKNLET